MMSTMAYVDISDGEYWDEHDVSATSSVLLSLVQSYDWGGTLARIASHPEETKAVGDQGRTPLHVACDHDAPAVVVQALLKAYPEASAMVGTSNMNPLHITCSSQHASVHVIRVLLDGGLSIQASMRDVDGDTPLHAACRCGAPIEVLELLLKAYPRAVNERDYEGLTPLLRLWVRYFVILGDDVIHSVNGPADLTGELGEAWNKTELLLRCATMTSSITAAGSGTAHSPLYSAAMAISNEPATLNNVFKAVHAAAAVDCPRPVVKIATIVHPEQVDKKDDRGLTPLLIAAQTPVFKVRDLSDEGYLLEDRIHGDDEDSNCDDFHHGHGEDDHCDASHPSVIEILLQASAEPACVPDPFGRLPLHLAVSTGKRWNEGVKDIIQCNPDALCLPDARTKLLPFMLAAVGDRADSSTVYEILRTNPAVIRNAKVRDNSSNIGNAKKP